MQQEQHDDSAPGGGELLAIGCDQKCQLDTRAIDGEFVLFMERNVRCEGAFSAADVKPAGGGGGSSLITFSALAFKEARRCEMEDCVLQRQYRNMKNKDVSQSSGFSFARARCVRLHTCDMAYVGVWAGV